MRLMYGMSIIKPAVKRNRAIYAKRGPHFLKCACPGCQNFFKSIAPYKNELEASLSPLGLSWNKPDSIKVLGAQNGEVNYRAAYTFFGEGHCPPAWLSEKNELGSINLRNPDAVYRLNSRLGFVFTPIKGGRLRLDVFARLPWSMETLNCIYEKTPRLEKPLPSRPKRLYNAAKRVIVTLRGGSGNNKSAN